jgi:hypothetical protein
MYEISNTCVKIYLKLISLEKRYSQNKTSVILLDWLSALSVSQEELCSMERIS